MKGKRFLAIGILVILSMLFGISAVFAMGNSEQSIEKAREALEEKLITKPGIAGIAHTEEEIIVLLENERAGKDVPDRFMGFAVTKIVTGKFHALGLTTAETMTIEAQAVARTEAVRPLVGGISISAYVIREIGPFEVPISYAGTMGMITYDDKILSNAHVIAMNPWNVTFLPIGTPTVQPGTLDDGTLANRVGELEAYILITFSNRGNPVYNYADAAIASLEVLGTRGAQSDGYTISGTTTVAVGNEVRKSGRTTGVTTSTVYLTDATLWINYGRGNRALFGDQILVDQPFIEAGDSGSAVDDMDGKFVGLAFAVSKGYAVVCKAFYIIDGLDISVE